MAYYLDFNSTSSKLVQISGITGALSSVSFVLRKDMPSGARERYIIDGRRQEDTISVAGSGYLLQFTNGGTLSQGVSAEINGVEATDSQTFEGVAGDVYKLLTSFTPSEGVIALGARANEISSFDDFSFSDLSVTDAAGTHNFTFTGTGNSLISDDSAITLKLVNFPTDNSQWVFYDDGGGAVDPEPELHEFSGNAIVNALSLAQISKTAQHNGLALVNVSTSGQSAKSVTLSSDSLVTALTSASSSKVVNTSGAASIKAQNDRDWETLTSASPLCCAVLLI